VSDTKESLKTYEALSKFRFEGINSPGLSRVLNAWHETFSADWIPLAVVQAAYQGRYKVASVEQILRFWQRRGAPRCNFDREFKRMILGLDWEPIVKPIKPIAPTATPMPPGPLDRPDKPKAQEFKEVRAFYTAPSFRMSLHPEVQEVLQAQASSSKKVDDAVQEDPYGPVIARLRELTRMVHS
jgi:hypothetical protein